MPKRVTTPGRLLVNNVLPPDLRDEQRVLDKKGLAGLLREVAQRYPEKYRQISHELLKIGQHATYITGGNSFGLKHMQRSQYADKLHQKLNQQIDALLNNDKISEQDRENEIIKLVGREMGPQQEAVFQESLANNNPLATQVLSGSRGNKMNLASLRAGDMLYQDHRERTIPIPVLRSYAQGLSPREYWAGTYGARKGVIATKFATQQAGTLSKQLNQISHRLLVSAADHPTDQTLRGLPVDTNDPDNEGALLAMDMGPYKRNTVLSPKILAHLSKLGHERILIRSPAVGGSPDGGVYAMDVGVRERGGLPSIGENVGLTAAQALSEPISQGQLSAKHSGGVAGAEKAVSGFDYINQLIQIPKRFQGGATHAQIDGSVQHIEEAPAGGFHVMIGNQSHYVPIGSPLKVTRGQHVEAGDVISEGEPNPYEIVRHKGIGEGKRYFIQAFRQAMRDAGLPVHRRNVELLSKGLINHVRMTDETNGSVPDDILPYHMIEAQYEPREDSIQVNPKQAIGKYLEQPYLHYSIGTRVQPSMLKDFNDFKIHTVQVHHEPPPFEPEMIRGMANLAYDPDWMTRMYGSGLKSSLLDSVHHGGTSDEKGTSFVPGLARAVDFGHIGKVRTPRGQHL